MNNRNLVIIRENPFPRIEFNSNGRRVQRNITQKELAELKNNINSPFWIDSFCYSIA